MLCHSDTIVPLFKEPAHAFTSILPLHCFWRPVWSLPRMPPSRAFHRTEAKNGFVSLFDGKTLQGWIGDVNGYKVEDGTIVCHGVNLFIEKEYANFVFRFEFKLPAGGNNGVGIRTPAKGDAAYAGMEIQILDDDAPKHKDLQPYQYHGSIYGVVPAKRGYLEPIGQWNVEEIVADGSRIKVTLNGKVIVDADLKESRKQSITKSIPVCTTPKATSAGSATADPVAFRNVRIKTLP